MRLQLSTWPEIEHYLHSSQGIIVPIGSTEQHGPNGLIGTDALCAEAIADGISEQHDVLIAPTITYSVAQFNLAFPGTLSIRASTLMTLVEDLTKSLARHGFNRIYFLNGHGANIAPLKAAFQDIYWPYSIEDKQAPLRCRLRSWWDYPQTNALRQQAYGASEGMHATPSEVAITQYLYPKTIKTAELAPVMPLTGDFMRDHAGDNHFDASYQRQRFNDGRVGSEPSLASPALGAELLNTAISEAYQDYCAFLAEQ